VCSHVGLADSLGLPGRSLNPVVFSILYKWTVVRAGMAAEAAPRSLPYPREGATSIECTDEIQQQQDHDQHTDHQDDDLADTLEWFLQWDVVEQVGQQPGG